MLKSIKILLFFSLFLGLTAVKPAPPAGGDSATAMQQLYLMKELNPDLSVVGIIWDERFEGKDEMLQKTGRAAAQLQIKIAVGEATDLRDVSSQFRTLTQEHRVEAVWAIGNGILDNSMAREFLNKKSALAGIPLFVEDANWVEAGAMCSVQRVDGKVVLVVNARVAEILNITVPDKYLEATEFMAAN